LGDRRTSRCPNSADIVARVELDVCDGAHRLVVMNSKPPALAEFGRSILMRRNGWRGPAVRGGIPLIARRAMSGGAAYRTELQRRKIS
jgi:hypothetical protein